MIAGKITSASLTRIADFDQVPFDVLPMDRQHWATGDYAVGEVTATTRSSLVELATGRMIEVAVGDWIIGAFYLDEETDHTSTFELAFALGDPRIDLFSDDTNTTTEAWAVPALQRTYWRAMVTVNLNSDQTEADSPDLTVKDNTGTGDLSGGAGIGGAGMPVYVVDGQTCIARNNADIWNNWSNPFDGDSAVRVTAPPATQNVHYSPFLDQFGNQTVSPDDRHGKS